MREDLGYAVKDVSDVNHKELAADIAKELGVPLGDAEVGRVSDGEISVNINETVINKIQGHADEKVADGYFSLTNELLEPINSFRKHKIIDWEDFIKMTKYFLS